MPKARDKLHKATTLVGVGIQDLDFKLKELNATFRKAWVLREKVCVRKFSYVLATPFALSFCLSDFLFSKLFPSVSILSFPMQFFFS